MNAFMGIIYYHNFGIEDYNVSMDVNIELNKLLVSNLFSIRSVIKI